MKGLRIYLVTVFVLTYAAAFWLMSAGGAANPYALMVFSGFMLLPALSVLITKLITREGWRDIGFRPRFRGHIRYYLIGWFGPTLLIALGGLAYFLIFPGQFDGSMTQIVAITQQQLAEAGMAAADERTVRLMMAGQLLLGLLAAPLLNIITTTGEELGWRGYMLPKLIERYSLRVALLLNGLIWGLWHAPMIAMGHNYGLGYAGAPWGGIAAMVGFCFFAGCLFGYISVRTGSFWPASLAHGSLNGMAAGAMYFCNDPAPNPFIGPLPTGVIGGCGFIIAGLLIFFLWKQPQQPAAADQHIRRRDELHQRKLVAPVIITVLVVLQCTAAAVIWLFSLPTAVKAIVSVGALALAALTVSVLVSRIKEIRSGEEDDLSQY
ncbi:MAG: type II CAAX endopeptidase family protein [Bacillota bacterium]|nr:type II CAAX endopeptidase family protein [Bacillota bacterium]